MTSGDTVIWSIDGEKHTIEKVMHGRALLDNHRWAQLDDLTRVEKPLNNWVVGFPEQWPYGVVDGRLVYYYEGKDRIETKPIADFTAQITEIVATEEEHEIWKLDGRALRGGPFSLEIVNTDFTDDAKLKKAIDAASGPLDPVTARMGNHLAPAIQRLTSADKIKRSFRYSRTGWKGNTFLILGREPENSEIKLPRKLPYCLKEDADLDNGKECLVNVLYAMAPLGMIAVTFAFQAPLARLMGWHNERYALFVSGRTGSLKTSFSQAVVSMYGAGFLDDINLTKFGEGATRNAIMKIATMACDMPIILDNYKPNTGWGSRDFVNLIHNILEGGEKDRLNRNSDLRETRPIFSWPLITGEDVPDTDPASLARVLVLPFAWKTIDENASLSKAQELAQNGDFTSIGGAWLDWLTTDEAKSHIETIKGTFNERRAKWARLLRETQPEMVNIMRVSSNLSTNAMTWALLNEWPLLDDVLDETTNTEYQKALESIAHGMAESTMQATEGEKYILALRELLTLGRVVLAPWNTTIGVNCIGWQDDSGLGAYILPSVTRKAIEDMAGRDILNGASNNMIYAQLFEKGYLVRSDDGRSTILKRIDGKPRRVLWLSEKALGNDSVTDVTV